MYLALYRKYRPLTFDDVIAQPHITQTLKHQVQLGRTAHAYLFTGSRGTGKTTCSKILAMAVNCLHPVDGNPCLKCDACLSIKDERTMDVIEIDAASNNSVNDIRNLREEAFYTPADCKYRVYIIDEVHMLSTSAFNAFLKIMEEPPEHVKFILATTEAHKVPATINSRCQRFNFRRIDLDSIAKRLIKIAMLENVNLEPDASTTIAKLANGGMRDAISLLDQCIAANPAVTTDIVLNVAAQVSRDYLYRFTDCIIEKDCNGILALIEELYIASKDLARLCVELIEHFRNILVFQSVKSNTFLPDEEAKLREFSNKMSTNEIINILNQLQITADQMGKNASSRFYLDILCIKLCTKNINDSNIIKRVEKLEYKLSTATNITTTPLVSTIENTNSNNTITPIAAPVIENAVQNATTSNNVKPKLKSFTEWADIIVEVAKVDNGLASMLVHSIAFVDNEVLYIDSKLPLMTKMLKRDGNATKLLSIIESYTGVKYKLKIKTSKVEQQNDPLNEILKEANDFGINVNIIDNNKEN